MPAGCFAAVVHGLRALLRPAAARAPEPTAAIPGSRTLQSTPESGGRAGYDGAKRRNGSKVHAAVDTLGHPLALHAAPADDQDRAPVGALAAAVRAATGQTVEVAFVDQGPTGDQASDDAAAHGVRPEAVEHPAATRGFVLLPRRWVAERTFAWMARFRRRARADERLATTPAGFHDVAFALLALAKAMPVLAVL